MITDRCFIIAEVGVNHNANMDIAHSLIDKMADVGADAVKFQTFKAQDLIVHGTETVGYQRKNSSQEDQFELLRSLELSDQQHLELLLHCQTRDIEFLSTAFDIRSLRFLIDLGIKRIKIPSGEITHTALVETAARSRLPMIVSTGMASLDEVSECVNLIQSIWDSLHHQGKLALLHCTSNYPADFEDVNLAAIRSMQDALNCVVGYSDHTLGCLVAPLAVAAGARFIEKHVTLDKAMKGPDHAASIEPEEFRQMVMDIRRVETILGDGVKAPRSAELETRRLVRKGLKFSRALPMGHVINTDDLVSLRPETGLPPAEHAGLLGKQLSTAVAAFQPVRREDFTRT